MVSIQKYIEENLSNIKFEPPLFYNSSIGIRFELGLPYHWLDDEAYFKIVGERARVLFDSIFNENNRLYVVYVSFEPIKSLDGYIEGEVDFFSTFFNDYLLGKVENFQIAEEFDEDTNELIGYTKSYGVSCALTDINYNSILGILGGYSNEKDLYICGRVYFIEPTRNIVYHIYDNRGLDVVSPSKESIHYLYREYNDWILNYDREIIDNIFADKS